MFFVSHEFSRFVNFAFLLHFVIVLMIFVFFLMILYIYYYYYFVLDAFLIIHFCIKKSIVDFPQKLDNQKIIKILIKIMKQHDFLVFHHYFVKIIYKSVFKNPFLDVLNGRLGQWPCGGISILLVGLLAETSIIIIYYQNIEK